MCWRFEASACFRGTRGQATVEAALLIPALLLGLVIAAQPGIVLFDRVVMEAAAAEGCRALETASAADEGEVVEYVQRRLGAVPAVSAFHEGLWDVEVQGAGQSGQCVSVRISHGYRPLPLVGQGMGLLGLVGGNGLVRQEAFCEMSFMTSGRWNRNSAFRTNRGLTDGRKKRDACWKIQGRFSLRLARRCRLVSQ